MAVMLLSNRAESDEYVAWCEQTPAPATSGAGLDPEHQGSVWVTCWGLRAGEGERLGDAETLASAFAMWPQLVRDGDAVEISYLGDPEALLPHLRIAGPEGWEAGAPQDFAWELSINGESIERDVSLASRGVVEVARRSP